MLCENCGVNTATTHIQTVINGHTKDICLCEKCAALHSYSSQGDNLFKMLFDMMGNVVVAKTPAVKMCKSCGTSFNQIVKNGRVGCADCYTTFLDELLPYINKVHGNTTHIGSRYVNSFESKKENTIFELREELKRLVLEEKYEEAAVVRDKIRELEEKGNG